MLGARTQKYADYLDICAAIVGRVPEAPPLDMRVCLVGWVPGLAHARDVGGGARRGCT